MKKLIVILILAIIALAGILTMYAHKKADFKTNAIGVLVRSGVEVKSIKITNYLIDDVYSAEYNGGCRVIIKRSAVESTLLNDTCRPEIALGLKGK